MKKLSLLIITTFISLTLCTAQDKPEDALMQIASSQEYAKYKAAVYGSAALIAQNQVDLEGIRMVFKMNLFVENLEAIGKEAFSQIRGGVMWYEYQIETDKWVKALDAKYQYLAIPVAMVRDILTPPRRRNN